MADAISHNGGLTQINFNSASGQTGEFPFINLMKSGGTPTYITGNKLVIPSDLDANGYSTISNKNGGWFIRTYLPSQAARSGNYVMTWDGVGTVYVNGTNTGISGSKTNVASPGRYVFTPATDGGAYDFGVVSFTSKVENIKIFHVDDETAVNAGEIFGAKFKERLQEAKFGVYRFLNWQLGNTSNHTTWALRKPDSYVTWGGQHLVSSIYAGYTTNSGDDYSVTFGTGAPADKQMVSVRFNADKTYAKKSAATITVATSTINCTGHGLSLDEPVGLIIESGAMPVPLYEGGNYYVSEVPDADSFKVSATAGGAPITFSGSASGTVSVNRQPTLNLNSQGAKPIKNSSGGTLGDGNSPDLNCVGTLVYDATLGSWLMSGGFSGGEQGGVTNHVPYEIMVRLCAEMGAHPYFITPCYAADHTDLMSGLADYIYDNGPPWMVPRFEGPNEVWNTAGGFIQTAYAINKAVAAGWGSTAANVGDYHEWYGKAMSLLGQDIYAVYGGPINGSEYHVICGVFTVGFTSASNAQNSRFTAADYVTQTGNSDDAANRWMTHVCCSMYATPIDFNTAQEGTYATSYAGGDTTALDDYVETLFTGTSSQFSSIAYLANIFANIYAKAQSYTNMDGVALKLCGYEGGLHNDLRGDATRDELRVASKTHYKMYDAMKAIMDDFYAVGSGAEYPSYFQLGGGAPSNNIWSVLEDIFATDDPPLWVALRLRNSMRRRFRIRS